MKRSLHGLSGFLTGAAIVALGLLAPNCQPSGGEQIGGGDGGSAGNGEGGSGEGGDNSGGSSAKGGSGGSNSGGTTSSGGSNAGGSAKGGSNAGGSAAKGGSNAGGSAAKGGSNAGGSAKGGSGSGGTTTGNGGATTSNGGTSGTTTSTSTSTGNTGTTVTFKNGKGVGAMTGYGYVALGADDSISDPTCGTSEAEITAAADCKTTTNWNAEDKLCMTGSIPALGDEPDYEANWGVQVALNATDPDGGGLGQSFSSVTITLSGKPTSGLRAIVHRKGDPEATSYCAALTSGTAITFTSFVTDCYNTEPSGKKIAATDVPNIDKIGVQVSSGSAAITVDDLCITEIEFAK